MADKTIVNISDWRQLATVQKQWATGHRVQCRVKPEAIPIIFVPGIMGSRLGAAPVKPGQKSETVWDPDDQRWFGIMGMDYYRANGQARKALLIDQPLTVIDKQFEDANELSATKDRLKKDSAIDPQWRWFQQRSMTKEQAVDQLRLQGWCEIAWGFYGNILKRLARFDAGDLGCFFDFPVYACGYNWILDNTISGADLSKRIQQIITTEKKTRLCNKVILVTHSMGGLVSRWAITQCSAEGVSLGAIHGAQPVTGAPVAYRRMRAGFEGSGVMVKVLGNTAAKVIAVLGNCAGGLELLPTSQYVTNDKKSEWLSMYGKDKQPLCKPLPGSDKKGGSDPYETIYSHANEVGSRVNTGDPSVDFLEMIQDPNLLDPGANPKPKGSKRGLQADTPYAKFLEQLRAARKFHETLALLKHTKTAHSYVEGGATTFDKVAYTYRQNHKQMTKPWFGEAHEANVDLDTGTGTDLGPGDIYYDLSGPDSGGDSTVPKSSATALQGVFATKAITGAEHSQFYNDGTIQQFTLDCIGQLATEYFNNELKQL